MVIFYALLGMLCWGLAPLFGKIGLSGVNPVTAICLRTMIAGTLVVGWAFGTRGYYDIVQIPFALWVFIAIEAVLATLLGDLAYFVALKHGNVNVVSLIMSCAPVVTIVSSYLFMDEVVTAKQVMGGVLISSGLVLVCWD